MSIHSKPFTTNTRVSVRPALINAADVQDMCNSFYDSLQVDLVVAHILPTTDNLVCPSDCLSC